MDEPEAVQLPTAYRGPYPAHALLAQVRILAANQRANAQELRDAVIAAHEAGASWSELGRAAGMLRETLFRQVKAGSPVVVVKASHKTGTDDPA